MNASDNTPFRVLSALFCDAVLRLYYNSIHDTAGGDILFSSSKSKYELVQLMNSTEFDLCLLDYSLFEDQTLVEEVLTKLSADHVEVLVVGSDPNDFEKILDLRAYKSHHFSPFLICYSAHEIEVQATIRKALCSLRQKRQISLLRQQLQNAENSRVDSEYRFSRVAECLNEGLVIDDLNGVILFANSQYTHITGYALEELIGKHSTETVFRFNSSGTANDYGLLKQRYEARKKGIAETYELQISRKDGKLRWLEIKGAPLFGSSGQIIGSIAAVTDITDRKKLEETFRWSQKMDAVGRLAGGVAHDFNNLLTVIAGHCSLIANSESCKEEHKKSLSAIESATEVGTSLTSQLLSVSRRQVVRPEVVQLNDFIMNSSRLLKSLLGGGVDLVLELSAENLAVYIDTGQLQQILMNMAVNARESMTNGGRFVVRTLLKSCDSGAKILPKAQSSSSEPVFSKSISSSLLQPETYAAIYFEDTGCGMTEKVKSHIFEPFFSTKSKGSGLGLSIVYGIVSQHGGSLDVVRSEVGEGSVFEVLLKSVSNEAQRVSRYDGMTSIQGLESVLLVEDDFEVRQLLKHGLEKYGYTIYESAHGLEALDLIVGGAQTKIDLLVTDYIMPYLNGVELINKAVEVKPGLKTLLVSGCAEEADLDSQKIPTSIPFLSKPFSPLMLAKKMREIFDNPVV